MWSDASDVGWGAHLGGELTSGLWSLSEQALSINARELLAVETALLFFAPQVQGSVIPLFADSSTAIAYLRNQGGTLSRTLNSIAQRILRSAESLGVTLAPPFILGRHNVMADALSRPNQVLGSEWSLKIEVFQELRKRWLVSIDLFATSLNHRCSLYFSPFHNPSAVATDALLQDWNGWLAYTFPPWALIPAVLIVWSPPDVDRSLLVSASVVSGASGSGCGRSGDTSSVQRSSQTTSLPSIPSGGVKAVSSCLETIQRFAQSQGFSTHVAQHSALARRPSSRAGYQARWAVFRKWCHDKGHSVSHPSLQKIADFLFWLRRTRKLSVSAVMGYRSMLSAVFRSVLPEISSSSVLQDLLRSFKVEVPSLVVRPPSWDLLRVLMYLRSPVFEHLHKSSLRNLSRKTLFLLSLATAKRVGELQALSRAVFFSSSAAGISYVPEFLAKTESAVRSLPCSFPVPSLGDFAAGLTEDLLLCPVRALREYVRRTDTFVNRPRRLFVAPRCPSRAMSKNAIH